LRVGAGVVILKHNSQHLTISQRLSEKNTVFQAELHAMKAAAIYLMDNADDEEDVHIMVDSQAAIKAVTKNRIYSRLVEHTKKALNTLGRKCRLTIHWIKAHQAWIFNEAADMAAKAGARSNRICPSPDTPLAELKRALKLSKLNDWTDQWHSQDGPRQSKYFFFTPNNKLSTQLLQLSKYKLSRLMRFLTGHCFLLRQNTIVKTGINPPPLGIDISCRLCHLEEETAHHVITFCEALGDRRQRYLGLHVLDDYPLWNPSDLDKFLNFDLIESLEDSD
jgi:ribonuclease HI